MSDLSSILADHERDWNTRLARLQGWRGADTRQAVNAKWAQRLAPAACGLGALAGALLTSPLVVGFFAATAVVGTLAPNHPVEMIYNALARRQGRDPLPANRAAKRLGCAIGVLLLGGSAVAFVLGATTVGVVLALVMAVTALFVAATGICVPSVMFTLVWGAERGACPTLARAARTGRVETRSGHEPGGTTVASPR